MRSSAAGVEYGPSASLKGNGRSAAQASQQEADELKCTQSRISRIADNNKLAPIVPNMIAKAPSTQFLKRE